MDYNSYEQGRQQGRQESNGGGDGLAILLAIIGLIVAAWACLYPLCSLLTLATWFGIHAAILPFGENLDGLNLILILYGIPSLVSSVVLWATSRLDHRLALAPSYRISRHLVRLSIFTFIVLVLHHRIQDGIWISLPPDADDWRSLVSDPIRIGLGCFATITGHLCLYHWKWLRDGWRESLEGLRLRPRSLVDEPR